MNFKIILTVVVLVFCLFCGALVIQSGLFAHCSGQSGCILLQNAAANVSDDANAPAMSAGEMKPPGAVTYTAENAPFEIVTLGSKDSKSGYNFELELSSKGAAVRSATFSGFDDRNYNDPKPLRILSPVDLGAGYEVLSLANTNFIFVERQIQLPLGRLNWQQVSVDTASDGTQTSRWQAEIKTSAGESAVRLIKIYKVFTGRFDFECELTIENLLPQIEKIRFDLTGLTGM